MATTSMIIGEDIPEIGVKKGDIITLNNATEEYKGKAIAIGTPANMEALKAEMEAKAKAKAEKEANKEEKPKNGGK